MKEDYLDKDKYLELFSQLSPNHQNIIINTFRLLVSYDDVYMKKRVKTFDIAGFIIMKRNEMGLTNKEICERATYLFQIDNPDSNKTLEECDFDKMLRRNTQSSKKTTNWLTYIARVLCFDPEDYKKHFTDEGFQHISKKITSQSYIVSDIELMYDHLGTREKKALWFLTKSLIVQS